MPQRAQRTYGCAGSRDQVGQVRNGYSGIMKEGRSIGRIDSLKGTCLTTVKKKWGYGERYKRCSSKINRRITGQEKEAKG